MTQNSLSECRGWQSIADLLTGDQKAPVAFLGAPQSEKSLTPGRCDLAPKILRETMKRFSVFDLESETDLSALRVFDGGDLLLKAMTPEQSFAPVRNAVADLSAKRALTIICGGNNAVTRPGVHGLGDLATTGLLTLDAHFDLRDTDCGLTNGNPLRALIEEGMPGRNIAQIGLAPFANTRRAFEFAKENGIFIRTITDVKTCGVASTLDEAFDALSHCAQIYVDFDIDVIDRAQCPGAPGARPGGLSADDFFAAARLLGADSRIAAVDLTEFDPSLDVGDITALTAGRWLCEVLAGYTLRPADH